VELPDVQVDLELAGSSPVRKDTGLPIAERLQRVNDLYSQGLITEQELKRLRSDILSEEP